LAVLPAPSMYRLLVDVKLSSLDSIKYVVSHFLVCALYAVSDKCRLVHNLVVPTESVLCSESHTWLGYWGAHMKTEDFRALKDYQKVLLLCFVLFNSSKNGIACRSVA